MMIVAIDGVKLRRPVVPGDQLMLEVDGPGSRTARPTSSVVARVEGKIAAEAKIRFMIMNNRRGLRPRAMEPSPGGARTR